MRVLTDPAETGAVTICLPEDVQAEIIEVPEEFLADREWRIRRPRPDAGIVKDVARIIKSSKAPFIIAAIPMVAVGAFIGKRIISRIDQHLFQNITLISAAAAVGLKLIFF